MKNLSLFEEQKQYLLEHKEELFSDVTNYKIGMSLNVTIYMGYWVEFFLHKTYKEIDPEIRTEKFLIDYCGDKMDALLIKEGDNFSLKEALKNEVKLAVVADFMLKEFNKMYPSEVKRKETVLKNRIKRAQKSIDEFFKEKDVQYNEISDIIEIYEPMVIGNGSQVDLHMEEFGTTLHKEANVYSILEYVTKKKEEEKEKHQLIQEKKMEGELSAYFIKTCSYEQLKEQLELKKEKKERIQYLKENLAPKYRHVIEEGTLYYDSKVYKWKDFYFYIGKDIPLLEKEMANYLNVSSFIGDIKTLLEEKKARYDLIIESDRLELTLTKDGKGLYERDIKQGKLIYKINKGKLFRLTEEPVLTAEVIAFEAMEKLRDIEIEYIQSKERAKEMFYSVLTEEEEQMFEEKDVTIIEGKENYYALINKQTYNNVVKIPKNLKRKSDIKALCIHPSNLNVPLYDGFAAIALALKSGDEQYVLDNSNAFSLGDKVREKLMNAVSYFQPLQTLKL